MAGIRVAPFLCFQKEPLISLQRPGYHQDRATGVDGTGGLSGESLTFQVTLPADPNLTDPAVPKNHPAGKDEDTGPRVMLPGLSPCFPLTIGMVVG